MAISWDALSMEEEELVRAGLRHLATVLLPGRQCEAPGAVETPRAGNQREGQQQAVGTAPSPFQYGRGRGPAEGASGSEL